MELLNSYNNIDIVLDTFPYSGGTTNFEASWMCVPILTMKGDYFISKCGESINSNFPTGAGISKTAQANVNCIGSNVNNIPKAQRIENIALRIKETLSLIA